MDLSFQRIVFPDEMHAFLAFDRAIFGEADPLPEEYWLDADIEAYWIVAGTKRVGVFAVELDVEVADSMEDDSVPSPGTVYSVSIGIMPRQRRKGYAIAAKRWSMTEAPFLRGRSRIVCNVRESNEASKQLSLKAGFRCVGRKPAYYQDPIEDSLVLEHQIP